jgi:DNA processing protein
VRDRLLLHLVPGLGPRLTARLLARFGSPAAVLRASPEQLAEVPHIGAKLAGDLHRAMQMVDVEPELALMARHGVHLLLHGTANYPAPLSQIDDPPDLLYCRGTVEPGDANAVALVGSRQCTAYGRRAAEKLAAGLVRRGMTVISGLARGIDGAAHRAALKAGGRTVAVLAGGLSRIYPPEHAELADEVCAAGALISESAMGLDPMAGMFPARNRLISGLARGVVVVEAAERSGALITAQHAAEQGRPVFAVPGPIDSAASGGTNHLIRTGAILVRGVEDILEELDGVRSPKARTADSAAPALTEMERRIWEFLAEQPRPVDLIARHVERAIPELTGTLMMLEMKKIIRRLPGNLYERA